MSDGRREVDLEAIAWPGFVDILSAVIIMFVFFVMIIAVALYAHAIEYKSKIVQQVEKEVIDNTINVENQYLRAKTKSLEETVEDLEERKEILENVVSSYEEQLFQTRAQFTASKNQKIAIQKNELVIFFGRDSISLTEDTAVEVKTFLESEYKKNGGVANVKAKIVAGMYKDAALERVAKRVSVARIFNVRNNLISMQIPAKNIKAVLDKDRSKIQDTYHWVKIIIESKK